ncbi:MAG TPA: ribonuclease III [Sphingobium sp.]|uniref:ribonuclease III n=1 Tax=Sphingobium sp. TaxID=1912891 RepID=UPI002ED60AB5
MALYTRALTHGSASADNYERLEFLGDRVLGLLVAEWLYELFPAEKEGQLSRRLNTLVTGPACADIARTIGLPAHITLGKQARDDGALDSDNVLGDVMESVIGALYLDRGMDAVRGLVRRLWGESITGDAAAPKHPKSALQEWAAANRRKSPVYELVSRFGPHHALRFRVSVAINGVGDAEAEGGSKQEAETLAAALLLEKLS